MSPGCTPSCVSPRRLSSGAVASSRDLFANFERMRREIDELFGDVFERQTGLRGRGFSPSVDVFYADDPPRAVVKADLAGIDIADVALEIRGRQLLIAGERRPAEAAGRLYQQIEIEHGPFRRLVELGAEVVAERGARLLRGRHPRGRDPAGAAGRERAPGADRRARAVSIHIPSARARPRRRRSGRACPTRCRSCRCATPCRSPRRSRRSPSARSARSQLVNDVLAGNRMLVMVASREDPRSRSRGRTSSTDVGVAGVVARMLKVPDGTLRILVHGAQRVEIGDFVATEPYLVARIDGGARRDRALARARGAPPQRAGDLLAHHRGGPLPARGAARWRSRTSTTRRSSAHMIAGALRLKTEEKQALLEERNVAKRLRMLSELLARELELVEIGTPDPVAGAVRDGQGPARVLPAPAAQGDPGGARRGRRDRRPRPRSCASGSRRPACPSTPGSRPSASCSASSACPRRRPSTA